MKTLRKGYFFLAFACLLVVAPAGQAQVVMLAKGSLTGSSAGSYTDLSGLHYALENGVSADLLGGLGSGFTYVAGDTFLGLPDRGPNAVSYNSLVDDTVSYIARYHTIKMSLQPNPGAGLPFTLVPQLDSTTLLFSPSPLHYGTGVGVGLGSGVPALNRPSHHYFTGRSDNFDPDHNSGDPSDARLDPESIRVSNNGEFVFVSDEYGPYVYQFQRSSGRRVASVQLPRNWYVTIPEPTGDGEVAANTSGRTPNKGMEGLAITPDGRTLVGIIQAPFIEDATAVGDAAKLLRIVTINIEDQTTHQYAYLLTTGSGVSDITAINDHEFLVDERDGKGLGDGSTAKIKQLFKIDLKSAVDVTGMSGADAATHAVSKSLFANLVTAMNAGGITSTNIPAKLEGISFGPDVWYNGHKTHTFWVANDNDFLQDYSGEGTNPNQFFVFGFTDADLGGSKLVPQQVRLEREDDRKGGHDREGSHDRDDGHDRYR